MLALAVDPEQLGARRGDPHDDVEGRRADPVVAVGETAGQDRDLTVLPGESGDRLENLLERPLWVQLPDSRWCAVFPWCSISISSADVTSEGRSIVVFGPVNHFLAVRCQPTHSRNSEPRTMIGV